MAKVTIQQITDAGFKPAQFGTPADWAEPADTGYLGRVIAEAEAWLKAEVGDTVYAVTTGFVGYALAQAEFCCVRAKLWERRAAFLDSNAFTALEASAASERRTYADQASAAWACARDNVESARAGSTTAAGSAAMLTHVETGPFAQAAL